MIFTFQRDKKVLLILYLTISLFSFQSQPAHYLVKTEIETAPSKDCDFVYTYDNLGRLQTKLDKTGLAPTITHYTYYKDSIIQIDTTKFNGKFYRTVYTLNAIGHVVHEFGKNYTYDNNGYLIREDFSELGSRVYTISNGDVVSKKNFTKSGALQNNAIYTYYPDIDSRDHGRQFMGKSSSHLVKEEKVMIKDHVHSLEHYTYTFDSLGRVDTETVTDSNYSYTISFTYY